MARLLHTLEVDMSSGCAEVDGVAEVSHSSGGGMVELSALAEHHGFLSPGISRSQALADHAIVRSDSPLSMVRHSVGDR